MFIYGLPLLLLIVVDDYETFVCTGIGKQYTYYTIPGLRVAVGLQPRGIGIK